MSKKQFGSIDYPHNRYNPLLDEWVLVCPHRSKRPWMGHVEKKSDQKSENIDSDSKITDPTNPLSPGATRSSGKVNEKYTSTYIFDNDFPALLDNDDDNNDDPNDFDNLVPITFENNSNNDNNNGDDDDDPLFQVKQAKGRCRVMCFHPDSNLSLGSMTIDEIINVIKAWINEFEQLSQKYLWIQIFENRGSMMGCSNPHPHCQIWSSRFFPNIPKKKHYNMKKYFDNKKIPMLFDYVRKEIEINERIILKNDHWIVLVPFWAIWPFETILVPYQRQIQRLNQLIVDEIRSLASIMKLLLRKYDNLFQTPFPYSMAWHGAPTGPFKSDPMEYWTLHAIYYPPLLRSATVKKFMVGYELAAQSQRDITPEKAAEILRQTSSD